MRYPIHFAITLSLTSVSAFAEIPGRPLLYETTQFFLDHFGLRNLDELPNAEELRTRPLPKAQPSAVAETPASPQAGAMNSE